MSILPAANRSASAAGSGAGPGVGSAVGSDEEVYPRQTLARERIEGTPRERRQGDAQLIVALVHQLARLSAQPYFPTDIALGRQTNLLVTRLHSHRPNPIPRQRR